MPETSDNSALSPNRKRIAKVLRLTGWISFWFQSVLGVVSTIIFLFAIVLASGKSSAGATTNPGTGGGAFFAIFSLLALYYSVYQAFSYTRIASQLIDPNLHPKKADTIKLLKRGLLVSLGGMLLAVLGAEAITGTLLGKSLAVGQGAAIFNPATINQLIQPLDIFVVLANTHTITAHFGGMVASIWLINRLEQ